MIIDKHPYASIEENVNCILQFDLILNRIDPESVQICSGISHQLKAHEDYLINKGKIAGNELSILREACVCFSMYYHPKLYADTCPGKIEYPEQGLFKCPFCLNDEVVNTGSIRI